MKYEEEIGKILTVRNLKISTTESCTGGLLSSKLTDVSGSSSYITLNLVTYANEAKHKMLKVKDLTLKNFGAVSEECAYAMAEGLHMCTGCDLAICTTGIAGPGGGTKEKPVGLVFISVKYNERTTVEKFVLPPFLPRKFMKFMFSQKAIELAYKVITRT